MNQQLLDTAIIIVFAFLYWLHVRHRHTWTPWERIHKLTLDEKSETTCNCNLIRYRKGTGDASGTN